MEALHWVRLEQCVPTCGLEQTVRRADAQARDLTDVAPDPRLRHRVGQVILSRALDQATCDARGLPQVVDDLRGFLKALGIEKAHIVAHRDTNASTRRHGIAEARHAHRDAPLDYEGRDCHGSEPGSARRPRDAVGQYAAQCPLHPQHDGLVREPRQLCRTRHASVRHGRLEHVELACPQRP